MRKVERVEVDGMVVVTAADSSLTSRANIRAQVKAAAERARARVARSREATEASGPQPAVLQPQDS
jgi:hypothetical protein